MQVMSVVDAGYVHYIVMMKQEFGHEALMQTGWCLVREGRPKTGSQKQQWMSGANYSELSVVDANYADVIDDAVDVSYIQVMQVMSVIDASYVNVVVDVVDASYVCN